MGTKMYWYFLILIFVKWSEEYGSFRDKIPNGHRVPHPCNPSTIWSGVGHKAQGGGGERNPFGLDFYSQGKTWTNDLCWKDSDGDGKTNGEELGDPDCEWVPNSVPKSTVSLSHPGVCEPWNDPKCAGKNDFLQCDFTSSCKMEGDAIFQTLTFPNTTVPAVETNYYCMTFDLRTDGDYHLIATRPVIKNPDVVHHMLLYGCDDSVNATDKPEKCGMAKENCRHLIGLWAVGIEGDCLYKDAGFKVGINGFKKATLEIHWNNPEKRSDYSDGSGLHIFLTKTLRKYDAGVLTVGQNYINIPPRSSRVVVKANCSSSDTSRFIVNGTVYITSALNHMHYLGREMKIEHYRNNEKLRDLTDEADYSYDSPKTFPLSPPVEFRPGDEIITTCVYSSMGKNRTVMKGDATSDEMCYGFLTFFPKENMKVEKCTQWQDISDYSISVRDPLIKECNMWNFFNAYHPNTGSFMESVFDNCKMLMGCTQQCLDFLPEAMKNPCVNGSVGAFIRRIAVERSMSRHFAMFTALDSCNAEIAQETCKAECLKNCREISGAISIKTSTSFVAYTYMYFVGIMLLIMYH